MPQQPLKRCIPMCHWRMSFYWCQLSFDVQVKLMNKFGLGANFTSQQKESLVHGCIKTFLLISANEEIVLSWFLKQSLMCLSAALTEDLQQRLVCCNETYYRVCVCARLPSPPDTAVQHLTGFCICQTLGLTVTKLSVLLSAFILDNNVWEERQEQHFTFKANDEARSHS